MEMKALKVLIPIWTASIPPRNEHENDYFLKIEVACENTRDTCFYIVVQWCTEEKKYFAEPVDVLKTGKLQSKKEYFDSDALLKFRVQLAQLGINKDRNMIDVSEKKKDYQEQLADIHPALVPRQLK